ncbi:hypothetical protein ACWDSD_32470 [Streptomyces spiralis]
MHVFQNSACHSLFQSLLGDLMFDKLYVRRGDSERSSATGRRTDVSRQLSASAAAQAEACDQVSGDGRFIGTLDLAGFTVGGLAAVGCVRAVEVKSAPMRVADAVRPMQEHRVDQAIHGDMTTGFRRPL